jgi:predicted DNA-binding protein YlxM (UPF0122 family)
MEDRKTTMTMLFDFFGDLLTEKQRHCFDLSYNEDMSLSEIAESVGISRQGVRDNIKRAENILIEFEEKTGVVNRFLEIRLIISDIESALKRAMIASANPDVSVILSDIIEKLQSLKG